MSAYLDDPRSQDPDFELNQAERRRAREEQEADDEYWNRLLEEGKS